QAKQFFDYLGTIDPKLWSGTNAGFTASHNANPNSPMVVHPFGQPWVVWRKTGPRTQSKDQRSRCVQMVADDGVREASRSATYCESMIYERSSFVCPLDCASSQSHGLCGEKPCSSKPSDGRLSGRRFYSYADSAHFRSSRWQACPGCIVAIANR